MSDTPLLNRMIQDNTKNRKCLQCCSNYLGYEICVWISIGLQIVLFITHFVILNITNDWHTDSMQSMSFVFLIVYSVATGVLIIMWFYVASIFQIDLRNTKKRFTLGVREVLIMYRIGWFAVFSCSLGVLLMAIGYKSDLHSVSYNGHMMLVVVLATNVVLSGQTNTYITERLAPLLRTK